MGQKKTCVRNIKNKKKKKELKKEFWEKEVDELKEDSPQDSMQFTQNVF